LWHLFITYRAWTGLQGKMWELIPSTSVIAA
jgi:hypothetical protein